MRDGNNRPRKSRSWKDVAFLILCGFLGVGAFAAYPLDRSRCQPFDLGMATKILLGSSLGFCLPFAILAKCFFSFYEHPVQPSNMSADERARKERESWAWALRGLICGGVGGAFSAAIYLLISWTCPPSLVSDLSATGFAGFVGFVGGAYVASLKKTKSSSRE